VGLPSDTVDDRPFASFHVSVLPADARPHPVQEPTGVTPMSTTTLLLIIVLVLLFGGGWGYSRRGR
jgi:hypothetical protein